MPGSQRDFLLQLASEEAFFPIWGTGIMWELDGTLADLYERHEVFDSATKRERLLAQMRHAFPGAEVDAPRDRDYDYGLNDPADGHVAHAALVGNADVIVTNDKRAGFKEARVLYEGAVATVAPHEFVANAVAAHPQVGVRALAVMSQRRNNPPQTPERILDLLVVRYGMDEAASILRPLLSQTR